jgi:hypothetical protein
MPNQIYVTPGLGIYVNTNASGVNVFMTYDQVPVDYEFHG